MKGEHVGFFIGIGYYIKAIYFVLTKPSIWAYLILPWIISLSIAYGFFKIGMNQFDNVKDLVKITKWEKTEDVKKGFKLWETVKKIAIFVYTSILLLLNFALTALITKPLLKLLSCKVEETLTGEVIYKKMGCLSSMILGISNGIKGLFTYLMICILLIILNCFPLVGQIGTLLVLCYYTAKEYIEIVFERRKLEYKVKKEKLSKNLGSVIGFGFVCIIGILLQPINVVGGLSLLLKE